MSNNLKIAIEAELNMYKSIQNINSNIKSIQSKIQDLTINARLDNNSKADIKREIAKLKKEKHSLNVDGAGDPKAVANSVLYEIKTQLKVATNKLRNDF